MTIPALAGPRPHIPNLARKIAVRKVLVDYLVGVGGVDTFLRVLPALLDALGPHLAPDPAERPDVEVPPVLVVAEVPPPTLTDHQLAVLRLLAKGNANDAIARRLHVSTDTVKTHLRRIYRRLGAQDRAHAVGIGYETGLLP